MANFEWDENKNKQNIEKYGVSFYEAQQAFLDPYRVIAEDLEHGQIEKRYFCFGKVKTNIMTVRFTYHNKLIRIIGAGYWSKGKKVYERKKVHK